MKNKILFFLVSIGLVFSSCQKDEEIIDLGTPPPPNTLTNEASTGSTVVLTQEDSDEIFAVLTWSAVDFGGKTVKYSIEMDKAGNGFKNARDIITVSDLKDTLTVQDINAALIQFGISPGETVEMEIRIRSWVDYISAPGVSNTLQYTLTPYLLIFPPVFIIGDAQGWNLDNAVELVSTTPGLYEGKARFQNNGKFRLFAAPDWAADQWGFSYFSGGTIPAEFIDGADGDSNFQFSGVTAEYNITVSLPDMTITIELAGPPPAPESLYVVLGQTYDISGTAELESTDSAVYEEIVMLETNTKLRIFASQDWDAEKWAYGSFEDVDELLDDSGDDVSHFLFTGTTGYYIMNVNLVTSSISLEETDEPSQVLFLVGDPQGWQLDSTLAMKSLGGNVFELVEEFENGQLFRFFKELDWNADQYRWSSFAGGTVASELADGGGGDSNFRFDGADGIYKITVSVNSSTITVEPVAAPTLHIIGDDQAWAPADAFNLTWMGGGKFQGTTTFTNGSIFRFFANNDPGAWDWAGEQWRYSSFTDGMIDTENLADGGGADSNFSFIGTTGTHTITVNINSLSVDID